MFTESEKLWGKVTLKRAKEILAQDNVQVMDCSRSWNTYGEFLFIDIVANDTNAFGINYTNTYTLWGLGMHDEREKWIDYFNIESCSISKEGKPWTKVKVFEAIKDSQHREYHIEQTERGELFELLADIGDDDGVRVIFEDFDI